MTTQATMNETESAPPATASQVVWEIGAVLTLDSAAHFAHAAAELPFHIGPRVSGGHALAIPGNSLAGALRAHLEAAMGGSEDSLFQTALAALFGTDHGGDHAPGALLIHDAVHCPGQTVTSYPARGAGIDPESATPANSQSWERDCLFPGQRFAVRFSLTIPGDSSGDAMLSLLLSGLESFASGEIRVGTAKSRGLGRISCSDWRARKFPLGNAGEWNTWLASDHLDPFAGSQSAPHPSPFDAVRAAGAGTFVRPAPLVRRRAVIEAAVTFSGPILIAGSDAEPSAPDRAHSYRGDAPVIPASSLAGAFRARALRIARTVRKSHGDGDAWVSRLFGTGEPRGHRNRNAAPSAPSRAIFSDAFIDGSRPSRTTRAPLDRFLQSQVSADNPIDQPESGGRSSLRIELPDWDEPELGLLLLVLKDLLTEDLPLGGGKSIGRGLVRGRASVTFVEPLNTDEPEEASPEPEAPAPKGRRKPKPGRRATQYPRATLEPGKAPGGDAGNRVNACIWAFQDAPAIPSHAVDERDSGSDEHSDDAGEPDGEGHSPIPGQPVLPAD